MNCWYIIPRYCQKFRAMLYSVVFQEAYSWVVSLSSSSYKIGEFRENISCLHAKSLQSCPTLCDPMDCCLPDPSVHGVLQARILEWIAMSPPGDLPDPGIQPTSLTSSVLAGGFFTTTPLGKPQYFIVEPDCFWIGALLNFSRLDIF